jgi:hypothetical protein
MKCPNCGHIIKSKKPKKNKHLEFVLLTTEEFEKVKKKWPRTYQEKIKTLDDGIAIHGYKYEDCYRVLLNWNTDAPAEYERKETVRKPEPPRISTPQIRELNKMIVGLGKCFISSSTSKEKADAKKEIKRLGEQVNKLVEKEKGK